MSLPLTSQNGGQRVLPGFVARSIYLGVLVFALALPSCTTMRAKFTGVTTADVGFFADQTITILSQADFTFTRNEAIYTREFFIPDGAEEKQFLALIDEVDILFQRIIDYSLNLVVIYETKPTDAKRIAAYADSLEDLSDKFLEQINLPREVYDELVGKIRAQDRFMEALKAAQPILNGVGWYMNTVLNDLVDAADELAFKQEERIDERYAEVIWYQRELEKEKYAILGALKQVYAAYRGDEGAFDRLRTSGAIRQKGLLPRGNPSEDDLAAIVDHLLARLETLHKIGEEIEPEWKTYRAAHDELDRLDEKVETDIKTARILTIVWVHAHYMMASGKKSAAEWFDIEKAGGYAIGAAL